MRALFLIATVLVAPSYSVHAASAVNSLSLGLATDAAVEAMRVCEADGYRVSVSVVELSGQVKTQLKGDGSTPHTNETAFRKAYSVVTFGRNYNWDTSAQVGAQLSRNPALYSAVLALPNMAPLPGAVAIKSKGEFVGAIGVSGAPGGDKDEVCARAGIAKITDWLNK